MPVELEMEGVRILDMVYHVQVQNSMYNLGR